MNYLNDKEYNYYINDIITNKEFQILDEIPHHNGTRLGHSYKVSYNSYRIAKLLKLDYISVARAGLLHDFYVDTTKDYKKVSKKVKLYTINHPRHAVYNSKKLFCINNKEEDIIKCHMFPLDTSIPKYLESWIVNIVDTFISTAEFAKKFSYQLNLFLLILINIKK